jgi:hypothetical protein
MCIFLNFALLLDVYLKDTDDIAEGDDVSDTTPCKSIPVAHTVYSPGKRICPGHERALSIQGLVQSLDMKEEGKGHVN